MPTIIPEHLATLRPVLFRFAMLQLRNESLAQNVVQDALAAVLEKPQSFTGQSSFRTYVIGIMKHKIIDILRDSQRLTPFEPADEQADDDMIDALFLADGHPLDMPRYWGNPDKTLEQKDFFSIMELCLERLPPRTARIFMMREWLGLDTEEICKELHLSAPNVWAVLYRARLHLRECLELNWFGNRAS